ncbi:Light-harvesting complex-like protein ohp1, chloroplastic [Dionaea muscipula]
MATSSSAIFSSGFLTSTDLSTTHHNRHHRNDNFSCRLENRRPPFAVRAAAKLPSGVEMPKVEPKLKPAFLGFTKTAEIWNSRASMIGLIGTFIVELILKKGILQAIGVDVGKGLDLPL